MEPFLGDHSGMQRVFTLLIAFFIVACIYEGAKIFNENNYDHYTFKLSNTFLIPFFAVLAYVTFIVVSMIIVPVNFNSGAFLLCVTIPAIVAHFSVPKIVVAFSKDIILVPLFMLTSFFWIFIPCSIYESAGFSKHMSLRKYSLRDHFTSELVGATMILFLPPLVGILAYRGLFLADSALDKVFGWIIAQCSAFLLSMLFFSSTLMEMAKVEKDIIYLTWTRKKIISTFLPSMIRNSVLQSFVHPGFLLTCMALLDTSHMNFCFTLYCLYFVFMFRVFPSFNWAPCLSGSPRRHTGGSFSDWAIFELTVSNNYTWLLALVSTLAGCTACSFILRGRLGTILFSLESLHAYIVCRFLGTRINATTLNTPLSC